MRKERAMVVFFDLGASHFESPGIGWIKTKSAEIIEGSLFERVMRVRIVSVVSDSYPHHEDIPQGSVLSYALFPFVINGLPLVLSQCVESLLIVTHPAYLQRSEESNSL